MNSTNRQKRGNMQEWEKVVGCAQKTLHQTDNITWLEGTRCKGRGENHLSISSGTMYDVMCRQRVSGLTSVRRGIRLGNHVGGVGDCLLAQLGSGVLFSVSDLTGVWFSTRRSRRGKPDVSPCHRVYPSSSK